MAGINPVDTGVQQPAFRGIKNALNKLGKDKTTKEGTYYGPS